MAFQFKVFQDHYLFTQPKNWPKPYYNFKSNPLTAEKIELGKNLFYDPILSADSSISCSSCHLSFTAFTHSDHALSHGIDGKIGNRNSLALINLAWNPNFMWDGGVNNLEVQAINPITHEKEMNETLQHVLLKLKRSSKYKSFFLKAFNDSLIDTQRTLKSLTQFMLILVSSESKYDSIMRKEKNVEFTVQEKKGYELFKKNCAICHTEPLFTNHQFENIGLPIDTNLKDVGRMKITNQFADSLKFKVPTLRNIEFSGPYFHDGRARKLKDVLDHYSNGIQVSNNTHPVLKKGISLSSSEKVELISFLKTLTDKRFLYNPEFRITFKKQ
jgi:cytochrome c peroxidase